MMLGNVVRRCCRHPARLILTLFLIALLTWSTSRGPSLHEYLALADDRSASARSPWCRTTFDHDYLSAYAESAGQYCDNHSASSLTCFSHTIDPKGHRHESFCLGSPALIAPTQTKFELLCNVLAAPTDRHGSPLPALRSFPSYWYETGPSYLFRHFIDIQGYPLVKSPVFEPWAPTVILVKREIADFNLWHNLLEIMSVSHTLDVLSMTPGFENMWESPVRDNVTILILDDQEDGPYHELWHAISPNAVLRATDFPKLSTSNIILPIPGAANPFWQGDWADLDCGHSSLLTTFTDRVLHHFNLSTPTTYPPAGALSIMVIDRTTKRRLLNQANLITALQAALPTHHIQLIDLATLSLRSQLDTVQHTDILVGVHGAGLTHGMFLPRHAAIVEFMPPVLDHRGFRNLAKMLGHAYRGAKTLEATTDSTAAQKQPDWQTDDVEVAPDVFVQQVTAAVRDVEQMRARTRSRLDALLQMWD